MDGVTLVTGELVGVEGVVGVDFWGEGGLEQLFLNQFLLDAVSEYTSEHHWKIKNLNKLKFSFKYLKVLKSLLPYWNIKGSNFLG